MHIAHTHTQMEGEWGVGWSEHVVSVFPAGVGLRFFPFPELWPDTSARSTLTLSLGAARRSEWQEPDSSSPPLKGSPKTWL